MKSDELATSPEAAITPSVSTIGSQSVHEFIRYVVASAIALTVDFATLALLTNVFNISYLISGAIAFLLGLCIVYVLSVHWVFANRHVRNTAIEFAIFAGIGFVGLGLNELLLWFFTSFFGIYFLVSKAISVIFVFAWNFAARKASLFA